MTARTFATASRATVAGSRRVAMMATTAGVATASVLSYAYLQSKLIIKSFQIMAKSLSFFFLY
jgi:hypothetical protein